MFNTLCWVISGQASVKSPKELGEMSKEANGLKALAESVSEYDETHKLVKELTVMAEDESSGEELKEMARADLEEAKSQLDSLEHELLIELIPKDAADAGDAIIELRPGTGGLEAGLFAMDMYRMYQSYALQKGWKFENLTMTESDVEGLREASATIKGEGVFAALKYESGVHRVQRIPDTETLGRVHTSTMTVAVLPEAENVDIDIKQADLRIETKRASGAGGQHVNTTDSAVRITHIPTGIVVSMQDDRSQHKNREKALKILKARLYDHQRTKISAERASARKSQVGTGDRSERIRTYNYPQDRITDHRISQSWHGITEMMAGEYLDEIVDALREASHQEELESLTVN